MATAFTLTSPPVENDRNSPTQKKTVLVTGAAGRIGSYFAQNHDTSQFNLRLMVRAEDDPESVDALRPCGEVVTGHAVSGYRTDVKVKSSEPVNPGDLYGVSKCFGEAMARYMAEQEGVSAICIRIGAFQPLEKAREKDALPILDAFVSHRDLHQLIEKCIATPEALRFAIFHGLSDNRFKRLDISDARTLVG